MYIMTPFLTIRRLLLCNIVRYTFPYKAVSQFITIHKQNRYRRNYFEMVLLLKIYVRAKGSSILVLPLESLPTFEKNDPKKVFLPNKLQGYIICIFKKKQYILFSLVITIILYKITPPPASIVISIYLGCIITPDMFSVQPPVLFV